MQQSGDDWKHEQEAIDSYYQQFRFTVHKFFIVAIACSTLLLQETGVMTFGEYQRSHNSELMSGPWYYTSLIVGDAARFVFFVIIVIMLMKNDEA